MPKRAGPAPRSGEAIGNRAVIRVGAVAYLNSWPLTDDLRDDPAVDLVEDVPAALADRLAAGDLEVALVPIVEWFRHPEWGRVPGIGIGSDGPVETVLVVSRVPFATIGTLGLDVASRTSVVLSRVVLRERFGIEPRVEPVDPSAGEPATDAWVVIGDPAFAVAPGPGVLDLGAAWREATGLPMTFAIWATREGLDPSVVTERLTRACDTGLARLDELARTAHEKLGLAASRCRDYLGKTIRYRIGEREEAGIEVFRARAAGWL